MTFFFFNDTATTEIYTLSLHDALPICVISPEVVTLYHVHGGQVTEDRAATRAATEELVCSYSGREWWSPRLDRKSTRLNSSHANISYAVFCLKKKNIRYIFSMSILPIF